MLKRSSFRNKLVLLSLGVLVFYQLLVILLNLLLLEPYYLHRVEQGLINAYHEIEEMDDLDASLISSLEKANLSIVIASRDNLEVLYDSQVPHGLMHDVENRVLPGIEDRAAVNSNGYFVNTDEVFQQSDINAGNSSVRRVTLGGITDRYIVDISTSYASISQATNISIQFSLLVGLLVMLVSAVLYSRLSAMVTRPVSQITTIANHIAHLDFSERCDVRTNDEIGDMSVSINTMSDFMQSHIAQLEAANRQLQKDLDYRNEQEEARTTLLANLSHDLKTPIGLISGYADGLRSGMVKDEDSVREYCDVICDESDRMMSLIVRMMEVFRLQSGSIKLEPEEFDLADLLNYTCEIFTIEVEKSGLSFTADYQDCMYICEDYFAVEQVVTNYMQNAVSHIGRGKVLRLTASDVGDSYRVTVFNSAEPMSDESLAHIWDSFYRGDKSRTRSSRESGLGLSIVQGNMDLLGGNYGARNAEGGVEFWAEFRKSEPGALSDGSAADCLPQPGDEMPQDTQDS